MSESGKKNYKVGKGKPPKSGQIKKGEVRNPNGRPRIPQEIVELRSSHGSFPTKRLLEMAQKMKKDADEKNITSVDLRAEVAVLKELGDRLNGKPHQSIDLSGELDHNHNYNLEEMTDDELIAIISEGESG